MMLYHCVCVFVLFSHEQHTNIPFSQHMHQSSVHRTAHTIKSEHIDHIYRTNTHTHIDRHILSTADKTSTDAFQAHIHVTHSHHAETCPRPIQPPSVPIPNKAHDPPKMPLQIAPTTFHSSSNSVSPMPSTLSLHFSHSNSSIAVAVVHF